MIGSNPRFAVELPLRLTETCSQRAAAFLLVLAVPAMVAVGAASLLLLLEGLFAPGGRAVIAQHPALGLEILAGIAFWLYLLGLAHKAAGLPHDRYPHRRNR